MITSPDNYLVEQISVAAFAALKSFACAGQSIVATVTRLPSTVTRLPSQDCMN